MSKHGARVTWACVVCGKEKVTRPSMVGKTCSRRCAGTLSNISTGRLAPIAECPRCGKSFASKMTGGQRMRHCSRACSEATSKRKTAERRQEDRRIRSAVVLETQALRRIARFVERPKAYRSECQQCGVQMIQSRGHGLHKTKCAACRSENDRASRRAAKHRRRARMRGAATDTIDPIKVFERDGWRCKLCGVRTLQGKRGTYDDNAPEMDHVIPLSAGGTNTWGNVQCACRKCNHAKGAKPLGQLGLRFAA